MPLLTEDYPLGATNAYGRSKTIIKDMPSDLFEAESDGRIGLLCYLALLHYRDFPRSQVR